MIVGGGLLLGSAAMGIHTRMFVAHAQSAPGIVVRMEEVSGLDDDGTVYEPVVNFTTATGQETTLTGYGSNPPSYEAGEAVQVLYDPRDPGAARINDFWSLWGASAGLAALGILFVGMASFLLRALRSRSA